MSRVDLAKELRRIRKEKKLTQIQLGDIVGVHFNSISRFETKSHELSVYTVEAIANALGYELTLSERKKE